MVLTFACAQLVYYCALPVLPLCGQLVDYYYLPCAATMWSTCILLFCLCCHQVVNFYTIVLFVVLPPCDQLVYYCFACAATMWSTCILLFCLCCHHVVNLYTIAMLVLPPGGQLVYYCYACAATRWSTCILLCFACAATMWSICVPLCFALCCHHVVNLYTIVFCFVLTVRFTMQGGRMGLLLV